MALYYILKILNMLFSAVESNLACLKSVSCRIWLHLVSLAVGLVCSTERLLTGPQVEVNWMCHSSQDSRWCVAPLETLSFLKAPLRSETLVENVICHIQLLSTATICPHLFSLYDIAPYSPHPSILTGQEDRQTVRQVVDNLRNFPDCLAPQSRFSCQRKWKDQVSLSRICRVS